MKVNLNLYRLLDSFGSSHPFSSFVPSGCHPSKEHLQLHQGQGANVARGDANVLQLRIHRESQIGHHVRKVSLLRSAADAF